MAAYTSDRLEVRHISFLQRAVLGGITSIADAHNLTWKLAYVLKGKADHLFLRLHETGREPIDEFTALQACSRFQIRVVLQPSPAPEVQEIAVELGYRYLFGAFLSEDNYEPPQRASGLPRSTQHGGWLSIPTSLFR
ncbi:uncharacterized protein Z518_00723 [Rhinocladiella mackenziei CBS 650.93]|uniref:FAD-binding domain-containing protein n=1 Tax=Rhinocladiella mackenziei CBS 650.93 TaxID=1442369 RepID=A0A0D2G4L6_9EURO|nr:uncharacterized protein Z518_00723 [Rhinocladiella mackenziei CBS 650.93]KIX09642.1 hypothetical protein Z518_00723 [Rhinocladiella mackenziei CBS 650.93]